MVMVAETETSAGAHNNQLTNGSIEAETAFVAVAVETVAAVAVAVIRAAMAASAVPSTLKGGGNRGHCDGSNRGGNIGSGGGSRGSCSGNGGCSDGCGDVGMM